jgi:ketosteroid isomerase-like protein
MQTVATASYLTRKRKLRVSLLLATCIALWTSLPATAFADGVVVRIPSVTRWVRIFSELESKLSEAVRQRDTQTVSQLLTDDFEMRVGGMPGNPIPRAAWIRQSFDELKLQSSFEQMAVHNYNNIAIVSFLWTVTSDKQPGTKRRIMIVDTWKQQANVWKLAVRYAASGEESGAAIPAGKPPASIFEKKE